MSPPTPTDDQVKLRRVCYGFSHGSTWTDGWSIAYPFVGPDSVITQVGVMTPARFPSTVLQACIGRPALEVIQSDLVSENYGPRDVIKDAFWDESAAVTIIEIGRLVAVNQSSRHIRRTRSGHQHCRPFSYFLT